MSEKTTSEGIRQLGDAMSKVSERCYCAGWLEGTEHFVPELSRRAIAEGRSQAWGHDEVSVQEAQELTALADQIGHWVKLDERGVDYEAFEPFPVPPRRAASLDRERERDE